ncbi:MAG: DUF58 domain-containing protein [Lentisphaerae bacterium]|jgi:uncharacterized protein (DUF58 family)|nr:DUF58 domain-containing protein [Lentisphaerota bacterium]
MTPKELAKKTRYIQIHTNRKVNDVLAGEYLSAFKGSGIEFEEVREYQPGDEVRSIDWNVTARQGKPYVKRFREERELTVMFAVDLSASGQFGSVSQSKNELSAELCALLSFSAVKSNDKVGMLLFTDKVERFIPPAKGVSHALRLVREVLGYKSTGQGTDIALALDYLGRVIRRRCVVFLVSDFQGTGYEKPMRVLGKRHDLIAVTIGDKLELNLPNVGLLELEDMETGELALIDTGSLSIRKNYERLGDRRAQSLKSMFKSMDVDQIDLLTGEDYAKKLVRFFRQREKGR